jgi:hypothetical protein
MQAANETEPKPAECPFAGCRVKSNVNLSLAYVLVLEAT